MVIVRQEYKDTPAPIRSLSVSEWTQDLKISRDGRSATYISDDGEILRDIWSSTKTAPIPVTAALPTAGEFGFSQLPVDRTYQDTH